MAGIKEDLTEDIYSAETLEGYVEDDVLDDDEEGFMLGYLAG